MSITTHRGVRRGVAVPALAFVLMLLTAPAAWAGQTTTGIGSFDNAATASTGSGTAPATAMPWDHLLWLFAHDAIYVVGVAVLMIGLLGIGYQVVKRHHDIGEHIFGLVGFVIAGIIICAAPTLIGWIFTAGGAQVGL